MKILVVEDEPDLARLIVERLTSAGFEAQPASSLSMARAALGASHFSLALLDRRLPDGDGVSLIADVRKAHPGARVLMLTALDTVPDKISALDAGADDYLTKPFDMAELLARVRANLRRAANSPGAAEPPVTIGRLTFDPAAREVTVSGRPMILHRRELMLLESLARRAGRATTRETLLEEVYGREDEMQSNALDALVSRLRKRLNDEEASVAIYPIRGIGYMLARAQT